MRTVRTLIRLGDAQANLSLRWAHTPFCWFCHEATQFIFQHYHEERIFVRINHCECFALPSQPTKHATHLGNLSQSPFKMIFSGLGQHLESPEVLRQNTTE